MLLPYRKVFLFPPALNIWPSVPPADDSCNVSVIALDVLENKAFGGVVSTSADVGFKEPLNVQVRREEALVVGVAE